MQTETEKDFKPFKFIIKQYDNSLTLFDCTGIREDGKYIVQRAGGVPHELYWMYWDRCEIGEVFVFDSEVVKERERINTEFDNARAKYLADLLELSIKLTPLNLT